MTKKLRQKEGEIAIYDEAIIFKRGDVWQFRLWLENERKYVRLSLKTTKESLAIEKAFEAGEFDSFIKVVDKKRSENTAKLLEARKKIGKTAKSK